MMIMNRRLEPDNTKELAKEINSLNEAQYRSFNLADDIDWMHFKIERESFVGIKRYKSWSSNPELKINCFNSNGDEISLKVNQPEFETLLEPGTYYLSSSVERRHG